MVGSLYITQKTFTINAFLCSNSMTKVGWLLPDHKSKCFLFVMSLNETWKWLAAPHTTEPCIFDHNGRLEAISVPEYLTSPMVFAWNCTVIWKVLHMLGYVVTSACPKSVAVLYLQWLNHMMSKTKAAASNEDFFSNTRSKYLLTPEIYLYITRSFKIEIHKFVTLFWICQAAWLKYCFQLTNFASL